MKEVNAQNCGRENDLLDFLYGELNDVEVRTFQLHVNDCAVCSADLAAFKDVRESVVAWRNESIGSLVSPVRIADRTVTRVGHEKPSALAALREFFNLSPLWMKGAVAFATVLFCVLAVLAVIRLRADSPIIGAVSQGSNANSEQRLKEQVAQLKDELERMKGSAVQPQVMPVAKKDADRTPVLQGPKQRNEFVANVPKEKLRRPLSKTEREQLAADLRLTTAKNDSDLDLLGDRINQ